MLKVSHLAKVYSESAYAQKPLWSVRGAFRSWKYVVEKLTLRERPGEPESGPVVCYLNIAARVMQNFEIEGHLSWSQSLNRAVSLLVLVKIRTLTFPKFLFCTGLTSPELTGALLHAFVIQRAIH